MTGIQKSRAWFLVALILLAGILLAPTFVREGLPTWWPGKPIKLGLDLKGGTYVTFEVQTEEAVKGQLSNIAQSLRNDLRKEQVGVKRTKAIGDRRVEITLINDKGLASLDERVRKDYPQLHRANEARDGAQVRVTYEMAETEALEIKKASVEQAIETIRNRVDQFGVAEPTIQRFGENQIVVQLPDITDAKQVRENIGRVARLDFRLVAVPGKPDTDTIRLPSREGGEELLENEILMTGSGVEKATVDISQQSGDTEVSLKLNAVGAKQFDRITADNIGRQLAIILDGRVYSAPRINDRISGGMASITGGFSKEEAHQLAVVLRSGALPAPLVAQETRTVGASLGADSIAQGVKATMVGASIVIVFMIMYYRRSGVLAVVSLLLNIFFLLAMMSLLGATLTLPGIAGLGLTIGMAVDANVIIYERIREELKNGASVRAAIEAGFFKAHWTILDANLTTLLTGIILYVLGTGPIKGFAVTLSLGIVTTIFAALFISKLCFEVIDLKDKNGMLSI